MKEYKATSQEVIFINGADSKVDLKSPGDDWELHSFHCSDVERDDNVKHRGVPHNKYTIHAVWVKNK